LKYRVPQQYQALLFGAEMCIRAKAAGILSPGLRTNNEIPTIKKTPMRPAVTGLTHENHQAE
jgi:hypothetical protein